MNKIILTVALFLPLLAFSQTKYQCTPCGGECDKEVYDKPGNCKHCNMKLVEASAAVNFKHISANELCEYIKAHPKAILLDVRTKEEFEGKSRPNYGTVPGAINIPIQELEEKISTIDNLKHREIIVFCSHSRRSPRASYMLASKGFQHVTNMDGGLSELKDSPCVTK